MFLSKSVKTGALMPKSDDYNEARKLLNRLSSEERSRLFVEYCPDTLTPPSRLKCDDLKKAENWFWKRIGESRTMREKNARIRIFMIFMLLRYGGLRISEIFQITSGDMNLETGFIIAGAAGAKRLAPLPHSICARIRKVCADWMDFHLIEYPLRCDPGQVRRSLAYCSEACGLENGALNASSMRRYRGRELERNGANAELTDIFLGRTRMPPHLEPDMARELITKIVNKEDAQKTSARNRITGRIKSVNRDGILILATLETEAGPLQAIITEASCDMLGIYPGQDIAAIIKATWVKTSMAGSQRSGFFNMYEGTVKEVRQDLTARETIIRISENIALCSLAPLPGANTSFAEFSQPEDVGEICNGMKTCAYFSPYSVILAPV